MASIANTLQEQNFTANRYAHNVDPSAGKGAGIGEALTGLGKVFTGAVEAVDATIKNNIQKDLFSEVDKADAELGITTDTAAEASIDLPPSISDNMGRMATASEAVRQGRMSETQFYNRMDSVVRQLRVKYPGYRSEIDKLAGQVIGFDTANAVRKQYFAGLDAGQKATNKAIENDYKLLENASKAGVPFLGAIAEANQILTSGQPLPSELRQRINEDYFKTSAITAQIDTEKSKLAAESSFNESNKFSVKKLENDYQTIANQRILRLSVPRGDVQNLDQLRESFMADGVLSPQEYQALQQEIQRMKTLANQAKDEFYGSPIKGTSYTFGTYIDPKDRQFDGGLSAIEALEKKITSKDINDADLAGQQLDLLQNNDALQILSGDEAARKLSALGKVVGPQAVATQYKTIRDITTRALATSLTIHGNDGLSAVQAIEAGEGKSAPYSSKQITDAYLSLKGNVVNYNETSPEAAYKQFKALFGVTRSGEHSLFKWSEEDRVKLYSSVADPEFSKFIREKGTPEMKAEYAKWLRDSFVPAFRNTDISNIRGLSKDDITGYQLKFSPDTGFSIDMESYPGAVTTTAAEALLGNFGMSQWQKSINNLNQFITTFKSALPEGVKPEDEAKIITELVESLGIGTDPDAGGGMWYKVTQALVNWEGSRGKESNQITTPEVNTNVVEQTPATPEVTTPEVTTPEVTTNVGEQTPAATETTAPELNPLGNNADIQEAVKMVKKANLVVKPPAFGKIISKFGPKGNEGRNEGVNISLPKGSPVKAAADGVIAYVGDELKGYGNLVIIRHSNGLTTAYAHQDTVKVERGDKVKVGQEIGTVGQTGSVSGPQLHFQVRRGAKAVDPEIFFKELGVNFNEEESGLNIPENVQIMPAGGPIEAPTDIPSLLQSLESGQTDVNKTYQTPYGNTIAPAINETARDFTIRTSVGEGRGEPPLGRQAIMEVIRNRGIATGEPMDKVVTKGEGSQFNAWRKSDPNYQVMQDLKTDDKMYIENEEIFRKAMDSDITKGATHYYNPKRSKPDWEPLFVETVRIGNHRFGYLKKDDPYRKRLMNKIEPTS